MTDTLTPGFGTIGADTVPADDLALAAELHGVEGWVRRAVGPGVPGIDRAVHAALGRHLRALGDLELVAGALDGAEVPFLVIKGPVLVATCYDSPDLRSYVDLDVLVRPADLGVAVGLLEEAGFVLVDANWPMLMRARVHELRLLAPSGGGIDLHWSLGAGPIDADSSPSVEWLLARSVEIQVGRCRVATLGPADTVIHLAVHAAASGGHRLTWLADLRGALDRALLLTASAEVVDAAAAWNARPAVGLMLSRAHRLIRLDLPSELRPLVPRGSWTAFVACVDRVAPPELAGTGGAASRLVARSCRDTTRESIAAAVRKTWVWWRGDRRGPLSPEELLDPEDPRSALFPAGGRQGAEAFCAAVAAGVLSSPRASRRRG